MGSVPQFMKTNSCLKFKKGKALNINDMGRAHLMAAITADTPAIINMGLSGLSFHGNGMLRAAFGAFSATNTLCRADFGIRRSHPGG